MSLLLCFGLCCKGTAFFLIRKFFLTFLHCWPIDLAAFVYFILICAPALVVACVPLVVVACVPVFAGAPALVLVFRPALVASYAILLTSAK